MLKSGLKLPGIDKIFLLNLRHRVDRLNFQRAQFIRLGIESFRRVEPVRVVDSGNFLNKSTKSIFLSHLKIMELSIKENITSLVLEDDIGIKDINLLHNTLNFLFNKIFDWDMFYFYNHTCRFTSKTNVIKEYKYIQKIRDCLNLHAYIINKKSLKFIYETLNDYKNTLEVSGKKSDWRCHMDHVFCNRVHPYINVYGCNQSIIFQKRLYFSSDNEWVRPD